MNTLLAMIAGGDRLRIRSALVSARFFLCMSLLHFPPGYPASHFQHMKPPLADSLPCDFLFRQRLDTVSAASFFSPAGVINSARHKRQPLYRLSFDLVCNSRHCANCPMEDLYPLQFSPCCVLQISHLKKLPGRISDDTFLALEASADHSFSSPVA